MFIWSGSNLTPGTKVLLNGTLYQNAQMHSKNSAPNENMMLCNLNTVLKRNQVNGDVYFSVWRGLGGGSMQDAEQNEKDTVKIIPGAKRMLV